MIVDITTFDAYTGNHEDSAEAIALKNGYIEAAQEIVSDYLGFSPEASSSSHVETISGIGIDNIYTRVRPITAVSGLSVSGSEVPSSGYSIIDDHIQLVDGVFPVGVNNVKVTYTGGWSADQMPSIIKMAVLQIASLMLQEQNGNIGITGKSFGDNSRSFINYTNYDKWLSKLDGLRSVRL